MRFVWMLRAGNKLHFESAGWGSARIDNFIARACPTSGTRVRVALVK